MVVILVDADNDGGDGESDKNIGRNNSGDSRNSGRRGNGGIPSLLMMVRVMEVRREIEMIGEGGDGGGEDDTGSNVEIVVAAVDY